MAMGPNSGPLTSNRVELAPIDHSGNTANNIAHTATVRRTKVPVASTVENKPNLRADNSSLPYHAKKTPGSNADTCKDPEAGPLTNPRICTSPVAWSPPESVDNSVPPKMESALAVAMVDTNTYTSGVASGRIKIEIAYIEGKPAVPISAATTSVVGTEPVEN